MGGKGPIAILAGNQNAPNLRKRVEGVKQAAAKYPGMTIVDTFYHVETPQDAAAEVIRVQNAYPQIQGWAMIGGWPLFTQTLLTDLDPKKVRSSRSTRCRPSSPTSTRDSRRCCSRSRPISGATSRVQRIFDKVHLKQDVPRDHPDGARARHEGEPRHLGAPAQGLGIHGRAGGVSEREVATRLKTYVARLGFEARATVRFDHITKRFPGVVALDDVSFEIGAGTCHALCGENGAGKSTLGKMLAGIDAPDGGPVVIDGRPVRFAEPGEALAAGVAMVHQELAFCENLSVAENLCLGALPRARASSSRAGDAPQRARAMLAAIGARHRRRAPWSARSPSASSSWCRSPRRSGRGARVIVFDEPTSSLSQHEAERLYDAIGRLRGAGRDVPLRQPPAGGDLPAVRRRHGASRRPPRRDRARSPTVRRDALVR